jgi:SAM-dependent methyltransferase
MVRAADQPRMPLPRAGPSQRGRYGIDGGFAGLAVFGLVEAGLAGTVTWAVGHRQSAVAALAGVGGAVVAGSAASYLYSTGPGKRAIWAQLLDELGLRGDEHVLDVGCGRGAVLMLAARRLPAGRAVGADVWRRRDQSGNSRAATERNAVAEGVRDRVELVDADARDLPFASASFDLVVSSLALSNIRGADGRAQALREAARVLRPGGRLRIVDDGAERCPDQRTRPRSSRGSSGPPPAAPRSDCRSTRSRAVATKTPRTRGCRSWPPSAPCSTRPLPRPSQPPESSQDQRTRRPSSDQPTTAGVSTAGSLGAARLAVTMARRRR